MRWLSSRDRTLSWVLVDYMEQGVLPSDERLAKKTVVESSQFSLMDGILYFVDGGRGSNPRIVVPRGC